MSDKERPEKKRFTTYLRVDTLAELQELSGKTGIPVSTLVQEAVQDVLLKWNGKLKSYEN